MVDFPEGRMPAQTGAEQLLGYVRMTATSEDLQRQIGVTMLKCGKAP